jgi:uncharacterized circularly permuted ATP-grasp superfamily protein
VFAHQKYKKQSKAIKTRTRTYILQQVSKISKRQCSPTRNIKQNRVKQLRLKHVHTFYNKCPTYLKDSVRPQEIKKQSKAIKTRTRTYILQQVSNISKRQCSSTRNIKKRVKQLRLEHVHTFYNKCPTYLKGSVRPPEI